MYDFAIIALLALGTVKLVDFLTDTVPAAMPLRSLLTFVVAVGAVVALDYSLFEAWKVGISDRTLGVWVTGFMTAGATVPWRAVFGFLTHDRARTDETLAPPKELHKAA